MLSRYKYPRTPHLPWSPGASDDDIRLDITSQFSCKNIVITEKMDGENTTLYPDYIHARSIDSRHHESRNWVKQLQGRVGYQIPEGFRICGENLYAKHSIHYENLKSYLYIFSVWSNQNICLSWAETLQWANTLGFEPVPVLYEGIWNETEIRKLKLDLTKQEGYVVRLAEAFPFDQFKQSIAKWVRSNHVQSDEHWMHQAVIPNKLTSGEGDK